jgi:hypothetical protein
LWCFVDHGMGHFTVVGRREEMGEVCYFMFHVPECTYPCHPENSHLAEGRLLEWFCIVTSVERLMVEQFLADCDNKFFGLYSRQRSLLGQNHKGFS